MDLNAIPVAAIDHIEILRDGAAAQYGSDAIAGVINIVLSGGVAPPAVTSTIGRSIGSFAGNQCAPDGLSCVVGQPIDFADGGLVDLEARGESPLARAASRWRRGIATTTARIVHRSTHGTRSSQAMPARARSPSRIIGGVTPIRATR